MARFLLLLLCVVILALVTVSDVDVALFTVRVIMTPRNPSTLVGFWTASCLCHRHLLFGRL